MNEFQAQVLTSPNDELLSVALEKYRLTVSILKKGYAQEKFRIQQICRSALGNLTVRQVTSVHIASYRDFRLDSLNPKTKKPLSHSTVRLEMSLLSSFFDICRIEWGFCDENPVAKVRKPKSPPGRERRMTPREERQIMRYSFNHSNKELFSIVVIALESAMRQSEILGLRWENINLKTRLAHLPETKNGSARSVPLSLKARDALVRLGVQLKGRVFGYTSAGIKSTWRFMVKKLGIEDLHFHDCRHSAISALFELGTLDLMEVAAISGHKSLAMLKRYTHLRANLLVKKLEGNKNKGRQVVLNQMIPYPANVVERSGEIVVRLLDFEGLVVRAKEREEAMKLAADALLRRIMRSMRDSTPIPQPDQYLDLLDEQEIVMVDPLADEEEFATQIS